MEGPYGGMSLELPHEESPIEGLPFDHIDISDLVCSWISTVGSTVGMMTGVNAARQIRSHVSKGKPVPDGWRSNNYACIADVLEKDGYVTEGVSVFCSFKDQIPTFRDTHTGLSDDLEYKVPPEELTPESVVKRVERMLGRLPATGPYALFLHLPHKRVFEQILNMVMDKGMTPDNTVFLLVGDHGYPMEDLVVRDVQYPHDRSMSEYNVRVICKLAFPGCGKGAFGKVCSSLDLPLTILDVLDKDPGLCLAHAEGRNLMPFIRGEAEYDDRIVRVDNRYTPQLHNRNICLVDGKYRYVFRHHTHWHFNQFYKYTDKVYPEREELFLRDDVDEVEKLIGAAAHQGALARFREELQHTETERIQEFFTGNLFSFPLFKHICTGGQPFMRPDTLDGNRPVSGARVELGLLKLAAESMEAAGVRQAILAGTVADCERVLFSGVFHDGAFSRIITVDASEEILQGMPCDPLEAFAGDARDVMICSNEFEDLVIERLLKVQPEGLVLHSPYRRVVQSLAELEAIRPCANLEIYEQVKGTKAAIWGAGGRGRDFAQSGIVRQLDLDIAAFIDSDAKLDGTSQNGISVRHKDFILDLGVQSIFIACFGDEEVYLENNWLERFGITFYLVDAAGKLCPYPLSVPGGSWIR